MAGYDYIIVGAGSAGCVLAARLSEDPACRVLLIEAGGAGDSPLVRMPAGVSQLIAREGPNTWGFWTQAQAHLEGRRLWWPRGRGLGGSSLINAMIYVRGHPRDYDDWGSPGWAFAEVLPYFKRGERYAGGADAWHGGGGPLRVRDAPARHPIYRASLAAGRQAGHPLSDDFNGAEPEGFGAYQLTIHNGERWSAARAYLAPAHRRPNLTVRTHTRTLAILIEGGRAVGVEVLQDGQAPERLHAEAEVLLCAGAVQSPQILQLSGVGRADDLAAAGVQPRHDLPGVGENLQDHLDVCLSWTCPQPITAYSLRRGWRRTAMKLAYGLARLGPGGQNFLETGAFLRSGAQAERPDLQVHTVLSIMQDHGKLKVSEDGFTFHLCHLQPQSRGRVSLASPDPLTAPRIDPNYLAEEADRRALRQGVKLLRDVAGQRALDPYRQREFAPGGEVRSDAEIDAWVRQTAETIYHPVGTCRMGDDADAVVDAELRVRGLERLRVVDASVMPRVTSGNTHAPVVMVAEKAADLIRGRAALAPQTP